MKQRTTKKAAKQSLEPKAEVSELQAISETKPSTKPKAVKPRTSGAKSKVKKTIAVGTSQEPAGSRPSSPLAVPGNVSQEPVSAAAGTESTTAPKPAEPRQQMAPPPIKPTTGSVSKGSEKESAASRSPSS